MHPLVAYIMCKNLASTKENLFMKCQVLGPHLEPEAS